MTLRLPSAALMADARRTYVPAIRWLRANGWQWRNGHFANEASVRILDWSTDEFDSGTPYIEASVRTDTGRRGNCVLEADVVSCQQAVDHLVTAGILPVPLHSLMQVDAETAAYEASLPEIYGGMPDLTDADGDRWFWCGDSYNIRWKETGQVGHTRRDRRYIERHYGPVSEVPR